MPAATPIYDLPYQVGTDPPCFGPGTGCDNLESLWCDFVTLVEEQLDENDATIGRTATAIPMAMLSISEPIPLGDLNLTPTEIIPFDTVVFDTDGMATPVNYPGFGAAFTLTPQRNGIYQIDFLINITGGVTGSPFQAMLNMGTDRISSFAPLAVGSTFWAGSPNSVNSARASTLYNFTDTQPVPRSLSLSQIPPFHPNLIVQRGVLAVYWHSDL